MRFERFLEDSAIRHGDKTALVAGQTRLSYRAFDSLAQALAGSLAARGVGREDRVLVLMDNCAEAAISIFAVLKAGATFSVINASTKAAKLAYIIANCEPSAILTSARLLDVALEAFGPTRLMFGSDWPVVTAHMGYGDWKGVVESFASHLSPSEHEAVMGGNAKRFYRL